VFWYLIAMRILELWAERPLVWTLFAVYLLVTAGLAWLGHRKASDMKSFAIGRGDMSAVVVGITLAASIASTATFVINPGFVYVHGLSALLHFAGAVGLGLIVGLVVLSVGFRRVGARVGAMTLPHWIGERYQSRRLATLFASINMLSVCFVVLIIGGLSIVMQKTLGLSNVQSLILIVVFVFGYVTLGGVYAHAYTNTVQGIIMAAISIVIVASGFDLLTSGSFWSDLKAIDPHLVEPINSSSSLFGSFFSVYVSGFIIGFALICQPHIITKALYVKSDREVWKFLGVAITVSLVFSSLLLVGLYARVAKIPDVPQDQVMMAYLAQTFSPEMLALVAVALLAAGMSTLDGILVSLSTIAANDLVGPLARGRISGHRLSQLMLVAIAIVSFAIALYPPELLGIFGQVGVYGIVAASAVPILFGILFPAMTARTATAAALTGLIAHFALYTAGASANPGVTAAWGVMASAVCALPVLLRSRTSTSIGVPAGVSVREPSPSRPA
jgi:SSS family solute:Na+ symporter/sodium/pantothenate symporter